MSKQILWTECTDCWLAVQLSSKKTTSGKSLQWAHTTNKREIWAPQEPSVGVNSPQNNGLSAKGKGNHGPDHGKENHWYAVYVLKIESNLPLLTEVVEQNSEQVDLPFYQYLTPHITLWFTLNKALDISAIHSARFKNYAYCNWC